MGLMSPIFLHNNNIYLHQKPVWYARNYETHSIKLKIIDNFIPTQYQLAKYFLFSLMLQINMSYKKLWQLRFLFLISFLPTQYDYHYLHTIPLNLFVNETMRLKSNEMQKKTFTRIFVLKTVVWNVLPRHNRNNKLVYKTSWELLALKAGPNKRGEP